MSEVIETWNGVHISKSKRESWARQYMTEANKTGQTCTAVAGNWIVCVWWVDHLQEWQVTDAEILNRGSVSGPDFTFESEKHC